MPAAVQQLRPAAPARARLAEAIQRRVKAADYVARVVAARPAVYARVHEVEAAVEQAETALREAREAEPRRIAAELIGDPASPGPTVAVAIATLAAATAALDVAERASRAVSEQERTGQADLDAAADAVKAAVRETLKASPEIAALAAEFFLVRDRLAAITTVVHALPPGIFPPNWDVQPLVDNARAATLRAATAPWRQALASLESDALAALPGDGDAA